ncbi:MAG: hypothetical protein KY445_11455 [Armatimonadetes bacterium]|nr:hypothetical protein [Armatimonadota bacterium]
MLDANRFAAASAARLLPGLPALPKAPRRLGATATDFHRTGPIEVAAAPSITIRPRLAGNIKSGAVVEVRLRTRYAEELGDLRDLHALARQMLERFRAMSYGPYSAKMLRAVGHPYGRDKGVGRRVPRGMFGRSLGAVKGVRGSVPTLSVVNRQSGDFAASWSYEAVKAAGGATMRFINDSMSGYLLAAGTRRMDLMAVLGQGLSTAWQKEISLAQARQANEKQIASSLGVSN